MHGNVIFTGDAAHLLPIFGVRGANTGFQDAQSLGWHLAYTVKGVASPQLLANYSAERVGAAREIIEEVGQERRASWRRRAGGFALLRDAVLSLSLSPGICTPALPLAHLAPARVHPLHAQQPGR